MPKYFMKTACNLKYLKILLKHADMLAQKTNWLMTTQDLEKKTAKNPRISVRLQIFQVHKRLMTK